MEINEEKRNQWQALKGMGFKAHWDYFWDYYKIHVIIGAALLIFVVMLVKDIASGKPYALNAVFINANTMESTEEIVNDFAQKENIDLEKETVFIDTATSLSLNSLDGMAVTTMEKIYAMIAAKELDVIFADPQIFEYYARNEMFVDLRDYYTEQELSNLGDKVYYIDYAEIERKHAEEEERLENGELLSDDESQSEITADDYEFIWKNPSDMEKPIPVGIIIQNSEALNKCSCYPGVTPIAGIVTSTERPEISSDFIRYFN